MGTDRKRPRIVIDASNLTVEPEGKVRTGIQEVVYQTVLAIPRIRKEFQDFEIILLPFLTGTVGRDSEFPQQHFLFTPESYLRDIERELGMDSQEVWGIPLEDVYHYSLSSIDSCWLMLSADYLHFQCLTNFKYLLRFLVSRNPALAGHISATVYDVVPLLFPEYCDESLARWYQDDYLVGLKEHVSHAICISRQTAADVLFWCRNSHISKVSALPLPVGVSSSGPKDNVRLRQEVLGRFALKDQRFVVFVGSMEPRKNIDLLVEAFDIYRQIEPSSCLKLVCVGKKGWKYESTLRRIESSMFTADIVMTGYLEESEMDQLIINSCALVMPSFYEGFGLPVARAAGLNRPTITSFCSSLPEACKGQAIFVNPSDPYSIAAGLKIADGGKRASARLLPSYTTPDWLEYSRQLIKTIIGAV